MTDIMRSCEQVYVPSGGRMIRSLRAVGVKCVRYAPSCASGTRFPHTWKAEDAHEYDIVVVGNRVSSRVPFKTMPGARRRRVLVNALTRRYGRRVAVFGNGWTGPNAMGPVPFDEQSRVYGSSLLSVGVDNLFDQLLFSNRLPVALACGVPLLYHRNPGFDKVFPPDFSDVFFDDDREVYGLVDRLLSADSTMLDATSYRGRCFFEENLTSARVARFVVCQATDPLATPPSDAPVRWQQLPALGGAVR